MIGNWLCFELESDAVFGRGSSIPGLIDQEIALDPSGCPYLHGRTLKGLLSEACADLLFALRDAEQGGRWTKVADQLFGVPGSDLSTQGILHVGHATLPAGLRQAIHNELEAGHWTRDDVTAALTAVRQQTALFPDGAPDKGTLRTARVILRGTVFHARLTFHADSLTNDQKGLLGACVKGLRRAGTARNRGRGRLRAWLEDDARQPLHAWYDQCFSPEVRQ
jgi:hypothetical protein